MKRREFLGACSLLTGVASLAHAQAGASGEQHAYARTRLIDIHGTPIRYASIASETNYVFQYPFASTPCFLLRLAASVSPVPAMRRERGPSYVAPGGTGPRRDLVAFSAICAHKLAYPTRDVSFIRYQRQRSPTSAGNVIHCCADHSVYDPAAGARVVAGPAPQPLACVALEFDAARDELYALGTVGAEQFDAFFEKYAMKLTLEYGSLDRARKLVTDTTVVRELTAYCRNTIQC
ncbi:MAG TPA: (2Fe-2S)-binding protein [Casimicrobiaceae bacterium]|nr:(2Fe-2S)-binding protein [Casimicrobiaceae bacterium]